jgi:hypothetical protein
LSVSAASHNQQHDKTTLSLQNLPSQNKCHLHILNPKSFRRHFSKLWVNLNERIVLGKWSLFTILSVSGGIQILKCHLVSVGGIGREWFKAAGLNVGRSCADWAKRAERDKELCRLKVLSPESTGWGTLCPPDTFGLHAAPFLISLPCSWKSRTIRKPEEDEDEEERD